MAEKTNKNFKSTREQKVYSNTKKSHNIKRNKHQNSNDRAHKKNNKNLSHPKPVEEIRTAKDSIKSQEFINRHKIEAQDKINSLEIYIAQNTNPALPQRLQKEQQEILKLQDLITQLDKGCFNYKTVERAPVQQISSGRPKFRYIPPSVNGKPFNHKEFHMNIAYEKYCSISHEFETKKQNLNENLERMPNSKGYLFKGVIFYGKLPPETDRNGKLKPVVLFERRHGDQYVHEITKESTKIFKLVKNNKGKNTQVFQEEIIRKKLATENVSFFEVQNKEFIKNEENTRREQEQKLHRQNAKKARQNNKKQYSNKASSSPAHSGRTQRVPKGLDQVNTGPARQQKNAWSTPLQSAKSPQRKNSTGQFPSKSKICDTGQKSQRDSTRLTRCGPNESQRDSTRLTRCGPNGTRGRPTSKDGNDARGGFNRNTKNRHPTSQNTNGHRPKNQRRNNTRVKKPNQQEPNTMSSPSKKLNVTIPDQIPTFVKRALNNKM
ncbi:MAG: hypothetical protein JKX76_00820 [Colwellia sp.]|nr:hypothetical protein [Colwellia sp.]